MGHESRDVPRRLLLLGCILAGLGVVLGAFGAHGLKGHFERTLDNPSEAIRRLDIWDTGVRYQMYHALALLVLGVASGLRPRTAQAAGWAFAVGIAIFSGCLYALALSDIRVLGAIVPLGGLSFIVGWLLFAWAVLKSRDTERTPLVED